MTSLISSEGLSTLGARAGGAYPFEYKQWKKTNADPTASSFDKGNASGKLFKAIFNYSI
jgi:hypothetical protein